MWGQRTYIDSILFVRGVTWELVIWGLTQFLINPTEGLTRCWHFWLSTFTTQHVLYFGTKSFHMVTFQITANSSLQLPKHFHLINSRQHCSEHFRPWCQRTIVWISLWSFSIELCSDFEQKQTTINDLPKRRRNTWVTYYRFKEEKNTQDEWNIHFTHPVHHISDSGMNGKWEVASIWEQLIRVLELSRQMLCLGF